MNRLTKVGSANKLLRSNLGKCISLFFVVVLVYQLSFFFTDETYGEPVIVNSPVKDKNVVYMGEKSTNTGWYIYPRCFREKPLVVYGVGCGEDISWDMGMVDKYGAKVYLFDPTPKSLRYVRPIQARYGDEKMVLTEEGMSNAEGSLTFTLPKEKSFVSMRQVEDGIMNTGGGEITVRVNTLKNWMNKFDHDYLDVLKIDIEGSEYDVLEQLIEEKWFPFTQLLVEFHQRFLFDKSRHTKVLHELKSNGIILFKVVHNQEFHFIKQADIPYCEGQSDRRLP